MLVRNTVYTIIIVVAFFGGAELLLALFGVRPLLLSEDPLIGFSENIPLFVEVTRPDGSVALETAPNQRRLFNYQEFPRDKDDDSYRIFCMGGSTTHGRPYYDPVSFCGWLRAYLNAAEPSRTWEVINAGGVSFASYRVAKLMTELKHYQPDLFIVYSGQNEFLEERSYGRLIKLPEWLINLNVTLSGLRTYTALTHLIDNIRPEPPSRRQDRTTLSGDVNEILNHTIGPEGYHRDDDLKQQIMTHFRLNMTRVVKIARSVDAEVIFVQPAINIKDMSPFKSEHRDGLAEAGRKQWESLFQRARALHEKNELSAALPIYYQALEIDDRYADLHFRIGQLLFSMGRYQESEQAFRRAVEEDIVPLRILNEMQQIVKQVATKEDVTLVDFPSIIRTAYLNHHEHTVFGKEYFLDHVHTNMEGYRLLAIALLDQLAEQGIVSPDASGNDERRQAVEQELVAGLDCRIEGRAALMLGKVLDWAGKFEEAYASFKRALDILGPSPMLYDRLARSSRIRGQTDEAIRYLRESLERYPGIPGAHGNLALLLQSKGNTAEAITHCWAEVELNPSNHSAHALLANLLEQTGDDAAAIEHYQLSLVFKPDYEYALLKLAFLMIESNRYDEALTYSQDALRTNPQQQLAHYALGLILQKQGNNEQARQHFSEAWRLQAKHQAADQNLPQEQLEHVKADKVPDDRKVKLGLSPSLFTNSSRDPELSDLRRVE